MKKQWISILTVGMAFGTAWAIRGQFGHEQGAAWAAGIGALALVLVAQRKDWYSKMLLIVCSSAIGWGAGGMISYGKVVGYGRSDDFLNASYGLLMLFVIGGLFGLLGGGFVGLTLDSSKQKQVRWGSLVAEMAAGGLIGYYFLVEQLEWLMTPPRSEAWAICLGAGLAMIWYMARNNHHSPLRVAYYSAMGAGFGFAFGNFLQILGNVLAIDFNMWNVMEYSIGFFGGSSMAYGVFSSEWPEESLSHQKWENKFAAFVIFVFIPYLVLTNGPLLEPIFGSSEAVPKPDNISLLGSICALMLVLAVAISGFYKTVRTRLPFGRNEARLLFIIYFAAYILISYCVTGAFTGVFLSNHQLYVVNFIVVLILLGKHLPAFSENPVPEINGKHWLMHIIVIVSVIILLSFVAVHLHGQLGGANDRFLPF